VAAVLWAVLSGGGPVWFERAGPGASWAIFSLSFLLAWRFQRSRVASALILLALWDRLLPGSLSGPRPDSTIALAALLMAVWMGVLAVSRDWGLRSARGVAQALAPLGLLAVAVWSPPSIGGIGALATWPAPVDPTGASAFRDLLDALPWPLPLAPTLGLVVAVVVCAVAAVLRRDAVEKGLLWALVCGAAAMAAGPGESAAGLLSATGALILGISVVELSYGLAYRDELTRLPTRRALKDALREVGGPYALAMVDVDHFKRFNDRHGHDVGDQVLRMVAAQLDECGGKARAFRYGGEEFVLLFAGTDRKGAQPFVEELRETIEIARFEVRARSRPRSPARGKPKRGGGSRAKTARKTTRSLSVTVSMGVSDSTRAEGPDAVLKRADQALYRAKSRGRNRVALG